MEENQQVGFSLYNFKSLLSSLNQKQKKYCHINNINLKFPLIHLSHSYLTYIYNVL